MANYYFTIGDGIQDGGLNDDGNPYLLPAYQEAYDATFTGAANGQYDRIFLDITIPFHSMPMPMGTERVTRKIMKSGSTWIRLDTMAFSEMMEDTTIPTMPFRMFSFSEVYQLVGLMALLIPSSDRLPRMASFIPPLNGMA